MIKDFFLDKIENAILSAINKNELGEMKEYTRGTLVIERPKNPDFGDYAVNVSSLARSARIAPPKIAEAIVANLNDSDNEYSVIGGFINFKTGKNLLTGLVAEIFDKKETFGKPENVECEKIILEYVCLCISYLMYLIQILG